MDENKKIEYINFPVSYLQGNDLKKTFIQGFYFGIYELMITKNEKRPFFDEIINKNGLNKTINDIGCFDFAKKEYEQNTHSVRCGVKIQTFLNYISNPNNKDDLELRAYCATKAIIGNKVYKKSRYEELFALMFGYTSIGEVPVEIKSKYSRYLDSKKEDMRNLIGFLIKNWNLSFYSLHARGFYLSYTLGLSDLYFEVAKGKFLKKHGQKLGIKKGLEMFEKYKKDIEDDLEGCLV